MILSKNMRLEYKNMQQKDIFSEYQVFADEHSVKKVLTQNGLLSSSGLNPHNPLIKQYFQACIDNIQKRNLFSLFRGKLIYLAEIQNVYSFFRTLAPSFRADFEQYVWKQCRVNISNKFEIHTQCNKCGDYTSPFVFGCGLCYNYSYCSQQCQSSHKYQHLNQCKRNPCPSISGGLPLQIHIGGYLQQNIQMSFKIKGKRAVQRLNTLIQQCPEMQQAAKEKKQCDLVIRNIEDVHKIYLNSPALANLRLILLRQGCIFKRMDTKNEQDNIHIVIRYLYLI